MTLNALLDSILPESEKCENERVNHNNKCTLLRGIVIHILEKNCWTYVLRLRLFYRQCDSGRFSGRVTHRAPLWV